MSRAFTQLCSSVVAVQLFPPPSTHSVCIHKGSISITHRPQQQLKANTVFPNRRGQPRRKLLETGREKMDRPSLFLTLRKLTPLSLSCFTPRQTNLVKTTAPREVHHPNQSYAVPCQRGSARTLLAIYYTPKPYYLSRHDSFGSHSSRTESNLRRQDSHGALGDV